MWHHQYDLKMPVCGSGMHHYTHFCQNLINCVLDTVWGTDGQANEQTFICSFIFIHLSLFMLYLTQAQTCLSKSHLRGCAVMWALHAKQRRSARQPSWCFGQRFITYYSLFMLNKALARTQLNHLFEGGGEWQISNLPPALLNLTSHIITQKLTTELRSIYICLVTLV